jgi:F-type H+-transporting ATPase subunit delta
MSDTKIASRYAKSLYDTAVSNSKIEAVAADIRDLNEILGTSQDLNLFLQSPLISRIEKKDSLAKIFASFQIETKSLFSIMASRGREILLPLVGQQFTHIYNREHKITEAEVTSAADLDAEALKKITEIVKSATGAKEVILKCKTDQSLIGGLMIMFDGKIFDSTISSQIKKLKKELNLA